MGLAQRPGTMLPSSSYRVRVSGSRRLSLFRTKTWGKFDFLGNGVAFSDSFPHHKPRPHPVAVSRPTSAPHTGP